MANFDLISEDDFFSGMKKEEQPKEPPKPEPDEDLFAQPQPETETPVLPEEEPADENPADLLSQDFSEDVKESFDFDNTAETKITEPENPVTVEEAVSPAEPVPAEPEPEAEPETAEEEIPDYYDDKQGGINYKPMLKWVGIVVVILIVFLGIKFYFFSPSSEPQAAQPEQTAKTAAPVKNEPTPQEVKRNQLFTALAAKTQYTASKVAGITDVAGARAKLSSVLVYGNDFMFEVFAKNRDALAQLNVKLKNTFKDNSISVVATESRPGPNGGILGVYKLTLHPPTAGSGSGSLSAPFKSVEDAQGWLKYMAENGSIKIKNMKSRALQREQGMDVYELDATLYGSSASFSRLLQTFAGAQKNMTIHKLTLNAVDQRNFNKKKYQARLILKLFI